MPDLSMTSDATPLYAVCNLGMTFRTGPLGYGTVSECDLNVVFEAAGGECVRMEEAIHSLGPILRY